MYSDYADDVRTISLCTMKAVSGRSPAVARVELYVQGFVILCVVCPITKYFFVLQK